MKKNIFLISPIFHSYEQKIQESLEKQGFIVHHFFYNEPELIFYKWYKKIPAAFLYALRIIFSRSNTIQEQINYRLNKLKNYSKLNYELEKSIEKISREFPEVEYCLVIKGFGISVGTIMNLKKIISKGNLKLYQWDSLTRFPNVQELYPYFDTVWTFETNDVKRYSGTKFYPTFFLPIEKNVYESISVTDNDSYDIVYIGTFTLQRLMRLIVLSKKLQRNNLKYFFYLKTKTNLSFIKLHNLQLSKKSLNPESVYSIYNRSQAILDLGHEGQTGLTTRIYEALYLNKLLVSNSKNNLDTYKDFIGSSYESFLTIQEFLDGKNKIIDTNGNLINKLHLDNWVQTIVLS